jgi:hypothetical protein
LVEKANYTEEIIEEKPAVRNLAEKKNYTEEKMPHADRLL